MSLLELRRRQETDTHAEEDYNYHYHHYYDRNPRAHEAMPAQGVWQTTEAVRQADKAREAVAYADAVEAQKARERKQRQEARQAELNQKLVEAARSGQAYRVKRLLEEGADVNSRQEEHEGVYVMDVGVTALHLAAGQRHLAVVKALIAGGANVNMMSDRPNGDFNSGALDEASSHGYLCVAKALLAAGADVRQLDSAGGTCLHTAVNEDNAYLIEILLKARADPNARRGGGKTPLRMAEHSGKERSKIIDLLKRYGAV